MSQQTKGKVVQIIGAVVDVEFDPKEGYLPQIYEALILEARGQKVYLEVQQHLGEYRVRTIAMDSTDGFKRGDEVIALGHPIEIPVGEAIRGRLINVVGEPIDGLPPSKPTKNTPSTAPHQSLKNFPQNPKYCLPGSNA
jgi:F-type H+-transporting ATPase subunit beta